MSSKTKLLHNISKFCCYNCVLRFLYYFSYASFMSWINETSKTLENHYRTIHRRENIKTKQGNKLFKIESRYILFTSSFSYFYLLLLFLLNMANAENETHLGNLALLQPLLLTHFVIEKASFSHKQQQNLIYKHA